MKVGDIVEVATGHFKCIFGEVVEVHPYQNFCKIQLCEGWTKRPMTYFYYELTQ